MIKSTGHPRAAQSLEVVNPFENTSGNPERRARKPAQATVCGPVFWTKACGGGGLSLAGPQAVYAGTVCDPIATGWMLAGGTVRKRPMLPLTGTKSPGLVVHA